MAVGDETWHTMIRFKSYGIRCKFAADRDWEQFHSPKNLAMALSVEVGELLERFQWKSESESKNLHPGTGTCTPGSG